MAIALSKVKDHKRQLQRNFDTKVERLNQELARVTLEKDCSLQKNHILREDIRVIQDNHEHLVVAHRNAELLSIKMPQHRNEAWRQEDVARARQFNLEQQLAHVEAYTDNLHEEYHQLYNQLHPYDPPGAAEMDIDFDEGELEAPTSAAGNAGANNATNDGHDDVSDLDSDHED
jgi:hypothetical protein